MINQTAKVGGKPHLGQTYTILGKSVDTPSGKDAARITTSIDKRQQKLTNIKILGGALVCALGGAATFKDGLREGIERISNISESASNIVASFFSLLFIPQTLHNEYKNLTGKSGSEDISLFTRMFYTFASLGFLPNTFSEPMRTALKSPAHMATTVLNLPNILFSLFSYTGGRLLGFIKAFQQQFATPTNEYRLKQEFDALFRLGNLGSSQVSVLPGSEQFVTGWQIILNTFKGDFGSVSEAFKEKPISALLGLTFNSWLWPFDYVSKLFDTTIRTAENAEQFENAFPYEGNNTFIRWLKKFRTNWHTTSNSDTTAGRILKNGRDISKILATFAPPVGMASIVLPVMNKYVKGEFLNREAQELNGPIGKTIGFLDSIFSSLAFVGHCYYTLTYVFFTRLPQMITSATFYGTAIYNRMKGIDLTKDGYEKQPGYIEPKDVLKKIFFRKGGWIEKLTKWAERKLDKYEKALLGKHGSFIVDPERKKSKYIREFTDIIAQEICYQPLREELYAKTVQSRFIDPYLEEVQEMENGQKVKIYGQKPSAKTWAKILEENKSLLLKKAEEKLKNYLAISPQFKDEETKYMMDHPDHRWITLKVTDQINSEIANCKQDVKTQKETVLPSGVKMPKSFFELLTKPKALLEVLQLKAFHITETLLPLWIQGFVRLAHFGQPGEKWFYRNFKFIESAIREGDIEQACRREYLPVAFYALENFGKGAATVAKGLRLAA